jgi:hypothetical protein
MPRCCKPTLSVGHLPQVLTMANWLIDRQKARRLVVARELQLKRAEHRVAQ